MNTATTLLLNPIPTPLNSYQNNEDDVDGDVDDDHFTATTTTSLIVDECWQKLVIVS